MKHSQNQPVFMIVQHLSPGGIEVLALNLLEELRDRRELHIVALEGTQKDALSLWPILHDHKNRLHFLNKPSGFSPITLMKLIGLFLRYRPQAVHTHHIGPMIYGGAAARLSGVQNLIHTEHDGWHLKHNGKLQSHVMKALKPSIICVANHVGERVSDSCNIPSPRTIYNGIDTQYFSEGNQILARSNIGLPQEVRLIGCAGRMEEVKGQRFVIDALMYLPEDVHLVLAGDGTLRKTLERHAKALALHHRVHFLGRVDAMRGFYRALDVFCLPSLNEGFPLSPLEAQACGIPAVLSDVGGCSEALCRDTGFLAQAGNAQDLANQLGRALSEKSPFSARRFIVEHFNLSDIAAAYDGLYTHNKKQEERYA